MNWYLLAVKPKSELTVKLDIEKLVQAEGLEEEIKEVLVPCHQEINVHRNGEHTMRQAVTFPGYAVINMNMNNQLMLDIQQVPNTSIFVGDYDDQTDRHVPTPMSQEEIDQFIIKTNDVDLINVKPGDLVRITNGSFKDMECQVQTVDQANKRATVNVSIFGRFTPVTVPLQSIGSV